MSYTRTMTATSAHEPQKDFTTPASLLSSFAQVDDDEGSGSRITPSQSNDNTPASPQHHPEEEGDNSSNTITKRSLGERIVETLRHFADLGFTSFGGPGVHVVLLR